MKEFVNRSDFAIWSSDSRINPGEVVQVSDDDFAVLSALVAQPKDKPAKKAEPKAKKDAKK